ncbi:MAG: hypothetical protein JXA28_06955 [Bacteroidetes bacterium]|nr:hypothetical protein [Bacteroidota bacterium]
MLSPPGFAFDLQALCSHLYGNGNWQLPEQPFADAALRTIPRALLSSRGFRFIAIDAEWEDFLHEVFETVDFVFFYHPETMKFHEVSEGNLLHQNPFSYAFTFLEIQSTLPPDTFAQKPVEAPQIPPSIENADIPSLHTTSSIQSLSQRIAPMSDDKLDLAIQHVHTLLENGWTATAISNASGINQMTLGKIKNESAKRITDKVYQRIADLKAKVDAGQVEPPTRGRKSAAKKTSKAGAKVTSLPRAAGKSDDTAVARPAARGPKPMGRPGKQHYSGIINTNYVPVDISQLQGVIDRLIANFSGAIDELESIKRELK